MGARHHGRQVLRGVGELVLTLGVLVLLYAVHLLVWTNVRADAAAEDAVEELRRTWAAEAGQRPGPPAPSPVEPPSAPELLPAPEPGTPFAVMQIPRLGADWSAPVREGSGGGPGGISEGDLRAGVVHYPGTDLPGERGNFAVAGHRATNGEPFRDLDRVQTGDAVIVRTAVELLEYRVTSVEIVSPEDGDVLLPVPGRPDARADVERLTLTTCHPRWSSAQRLVVHAELAARTPAPA